MMAFQHNFNRQAKRRGRRHCAIIHMKPLAGDTVLDTTFGLEASLRNKSHEPIQQAIDLRYHIRNSA